jgi:uncharacterized membrane protein
MRQKRSWKQRRRLADPIEEHVAFDDTETKIALSGHPIHAMMVAFPIALAFSTLGADGMYWLTADEFWPRVALWAAGIAFVLGVLAGIAGTVELLMVPGIRIRSASWTHFILAVMLLSLLGLNWGFRLPDPQGAVLPWGAMISALTAVMTGITGWHGGKLVFDYSIGTQRKGGA